MKSAIVWILGASAAVAASSQAWEMTTWQDFLKGQFKGVAVTRDGRLTLAPATSTLFEDGQSSVWCAVRGSAGVTYFGTGHKGRIIRIDAKGASTVVWTAPEPEVFAMALDSKGVLYAGTSPNGKIYRIENGSASVYYDPQSRYIWSLEFAADGRLFAGTGDNGKVFAITGAGAGEVWFESGQSHITSLQMDAQGMLLAGSDPNGILYRISAKNKAFVIYDADLPEIRSLALGPDGLIYVAALGGSVAKRANAAGLGVTAPTFSVTAPVTTITVEAQAGMEVKPKAETQKTQPAVSAMATPIEVSGVEKSAIYRISPDGSVETLWSSKEENAYDVALNGNLLYFSTDGPGRIYQLDAARKIRLITQTNEGEITRLLESGGKFVAATANQGRILAVTGKPGPSGEYESPVHDAGSISRWGRLDWNAAGAGQTTLQTRTGNSARPDTTWSEWSTPLGAPGAIASPSARFVQWRAAFSGAAPDIDSVSVAYRPQNNAPSVKSISVVSQLVPAPQSSKAPVTPSGAAYSITVTDSGDTGASTLSGTSTQNPGRAGLRQLMISWVTEDLDGDSLMYTLSFRGDGEREWKLLKNNLTDSSFLLDGDALADGRYFFRVVATDRPANPTADAREDELISSPVRIDNTPPTVELTRNGNAVTVRAADATSPLRRCELSVDARPWVVVEAEDGVTDSREEAFRIQIESLPPGEHLLTVRVTDAAGNPGLGKLVFQN